MTRFTSSLLVLVSAAVVASAQQEGCAKQVVVASEADLASLAACSTFSGTVTISGPAITAISWPALQSLTGSIQVKSNPHLSTFALEGLKASTGSIRLYNNTVLSAVSFPSLQSLHALEIITAPNLRQLSLSTIDSLGSLTLEDTGLDNSGQLPWSTLQKATDLGVSNNKYLKTIEMGHLQSVSGKFVIAANGLSDSKYSAASSISSSTPSADSTTSPGGTILSLTNLTTASNCTFRHLTDLQLPVLSTVSASLSFDETSLTSIVIPHLKSVGQTLSIVSNDKLSNISFSDLTAIGGALLIANNTELTVVDGFRQLKDISGVLNMRGAFSTVSLPAVTTVKGGMSVLSSSNDFDCSTLSKVKASAKGKTVCQAKVKSARPTNADGGSLENKGSLNVIAKGTMWSAVVTMSFLAFAL
ncbi:hypothetical protein EMPS_06853 [Entomortierella parvispora]|uniref:Uncharacterized protein n=1 Tax=Entomortierella parvispora TaxID=205924 RepID=A0A9P3HDF0_9FUNG|nr:hypothetical protein EMPS_06853 [Entomortierella parvispora]